MPQDQMQYLYANTLPCILPFLKGYLNEFFTRNFIYCFIYLFFFCFFSLKGKALTHHMYNLSGTRKPVKGPPQINNPVLNHFPQQLFTVSPKASSSILFNL